MESVYISKAIDKKANLSREINLNTQPIKEYLSGSIEKTYNNKDNGFCVLRIKVKGYPS
jgi:hypothetical protein